MSLSADFFSSPKADTFTFTNPGDMIVGEVIYSGDQVRENRFRKQDERVVKIVLRQDNGEETTIWPTVCDHIDANGNPVGKPDGMAQAIGDALRHAEGPSGSLRIGGRLAVQLAELVPTDKGNPFKRFIAEWAPPRVMQPQPAAAVAPQPMTQPPAMQPQPQPMMQPQPAAVAPQPIAHPQAGSLLS